MLTGILAPVTTGASATLLAVVQAVAMVYGTGLPLAVMLAKGLALRNAIGAGQSSQRSQESPRTVLARVLVSVLLDAALTLLLVFGGDIIVTDADIAAHSRRPQSRWLVSDAPVGRVVLIMLGILRFLQCVRALRVASALANADQRLARRTAVSLRFVVAACVLAACTAPAVQAAESEMALSSAWAIASCGPAFGLIFGMYWKSLSTTLMRCCCSKRGRRFRKARRSVTGSAQAFLAAPVRVATAASTSEFTSEAVTAMVEELTVSLGGEKPSFAVVFYTEQHDPAEVRRLLVEAMPHTPFVGCSTCRGVMKDAGWVSKDDRAIGLWGMFDAEGVFGVGSVDMTGLDVAGVEAAVDAEAARLIAEVAPASEDVRFDPKLSNSINTNPTSARTLPHLGSRNSNTTRVIPSTPELSSHGSATYGRVSGFGLPPAEPSPAAATERTVTGGATTYTFADSPARSGHKASPGFLWLNSPPGMEEAVMRALQGQAGQGVPITGGTSGDNLVIGKWSQISSRPGGVYTNGAVFAMCWPVVEVKAAFLSSYAAHSSTGFITGCDGARRIISIDGKPAAETYNRWTGGLLEEPLAEAVASGAPVSIIHRTCLRPLGRRVGYDIDDEPFYKLMHMHMVQPDGSLTVFANAETGQRIRLMGATKELIIRRVGRFASYVVRGTNVRLSEVKGAIGVFCAGCMLTAEDEMDRVSAELSKAVSGAPVMGLHGFGEQGQFPNGESHHANLMYSTLIILSRRITARQRRPSLGVRVAPAGAVVKVERVSKSARKAKVR